MKTNFKILSSFYFLFGLFVLLLNDFILKGLYGNWITGKLSDFAGLFVFSLFWCAIFSKHIKKVFWTVGILFIFWKSVYSQPVIDLWNSMGIFQVSRVVDYSDLIALVILPIADNFYKRKDKVLKLKLHPIIPLLIAAFSFCATSSPEVSVKFNETFRFPVSKSGLIQKINTLNSTDSLFNNKPVSLEINNSNDFMLDFDSTFVDTIWYYASDYDTIYDTMWVYKEVFRPNKNGLFVNEKTDEIDTVFHYIHPMRDTMYVNRSGIFFYQIPQKSYNSKSKAAFYYQANAKLRIAGNKDSSSLTLLGIRADAYADDEKAERDSLLNDFKLYFIDKIQNAP